ncbi:ParA family protein [Agrobacterium cavarae]|uniref:ParA family protein n=1 Tax=Agrobacterium cavarae TaxID=2528239 RepID=A0ABY1Y1V8_9HYPH|nr:AAA family ATPase [Agrobacterium cavarae]TBN08086.1 ParA family protein [Agrobacterium cavarae]
MEKRRTRASVGLPLTEEQKVVFDTAKKAGPHAVCFFNNKGGVGKTTLVANLGAELALNFGARVLLVDCDPQCNLTQYALGDEESLKLYSDADPQSVYSVIRPLALGKGYSSNLPIIKPEKFGFDLVVGDPRLALQEDLLAQDWRDAKAGGMRGIQTTFVFFDLLKKAKDLNYDFVLFDMGPSLGAINRSILLAVDYFVVPMAIDIFSIWAIRNIGQTVSVWRRELQSGISIAEDPSELPEFERDHSLKFIGYVTQQHKERGFTKSDDDKDGGQTKRIVQAYQEINKNIPAEIEKSLSPFYTKGNINPHLGEVRHLGSLAPMSQSQNTPLLNVAAGGGYIQLRKQAREIYRDIAEKFLSNIVSA